MSKLIVGFDSAWTRHNSGALVGCVVDIDGSIKELGPPGIANFGDAKVEIDGWQADHQPSSTLILIDQPTIVTNMVGQRPVENIVASVVSKRRGGMQPSNRRRLEMFGDDAPIWPFLQTFGGSIEPAPALAPSSGVIETYPVLALVALNIVVPVAGHPHRVRLPKYNPERRRTFKLEDWARVCQAVASELDGLGATEAAAWARDQERAQRPSKPLQDQLDACLCLVVGLHLALGRPSLCVGDQTGFIVVPHSDSLHDELAARCTATERDPTGWIREMYCGIHP